MTLKVRKWGNGYGILLPKMILQKMQIQENQHLDFVFKDNDLVLQKVEAKEYSLEDIIKKAKVKKSHPETDWGSDVGQEVW
jgi:antitoxin MazE